MRTHLSAIAFVALALVAKAACSQDAKLLERGTYLMNSIVACGNCHAQRDKQGRVMPELGLSGGMVFDEKPFKAYASNITPDPETGIGKWTEKELIRGIREGLRPDGSLIGPPMPIHMYRGMSDDDARSLAIYLKGQPAVKNVVPKSVYYMKLPSRYGPAIKNAIVAPPRTNKVQYGAYLTGPLGHCVDCHTPYNDKGMDMTKIGAGGTPFTGPWGVSVSRNITPRSLKTWSDVEIANAIRTGKSRDGSPLKPPMAFDWYKNINDEDMSALIGYLRSLRPLPFGGAPAAKP